MSAAFRPPPNAECGSCRRSPTSSRSFKRRDANFPRRRREVTRFSANSPLCAPPSTRTCAKAAVSIRNFASGAPPVSINVALAERKVAPVRKFLRKSSLHFSSRKIARLRLALKIRFFSTCAASSLGVAVLLCGFRRRSPFVARCHNSAYETKNFMSLK